MKAMVLHKVRTPLIMEECPLPSPGPGEIRVAVEACAVCRTDLHVVDGDLPHPKLPLIPGHEIVGRVEALGSGVRDHKLGERVGIPWLGHTCGHCPYCVSGHENLCDEPLFTGYTRDGGFASHVIADAAYAFGLPEDDDPVALAPLLCAGLIGWRSLVAAGPGERIGIFGFGAAAHIITQVCTWQGRRVFAFTRPGDVAAQDFARSLGAVWAGGSDQEPPERLDAAIIFAPVGELVPIALRARAKGRPRRLRRHPHERHPPVPLSASLGGAADRIRRQPDPSGCLGFPGDRSQGPDQDTDGALSAGGRQRGLGRPAVRTAPGGRGPDPLMQDESRCHWSGNRTTR